MLPGPAHIPGQALIPRINWALGAFCIAVVGCEVLPPSFVLPPDRYPDTQVTTPDDPTISVGDVIEVSYFKSYESDGPYRIEIHDSIRVNVENRPELTHTAEVLPDGTCTLPLLGAVPIRGKTVEQAIDDLAARYAEHLEEPKVDVLLTQPAGRVRDFLSSLRDSPDGAVRKIVVTREGIATLPLIEPVPVLLRPLAEVRADIKSAYHEVFPELNVNVVLARRAVRAVSVMGEVLRAGVFDVDNSMTVMRGLALAGGLTDRAYLQQVLLVNPQSDGSLRVRVLNLADSLSGKQASGWSMPLRGNEVLYVPHKPIVNVNIFVDQYIRRNLPLDIGTGFNLTDL